MNELRHTGFTDTTHAVNLIVSDDPGYGSQFSAALAENYAGTSGSQGNFAIIEL